MVPCDRNQTLFLLVGCTSSGSGRIGSARKSVTPGDAGLLRRSLTSESGVASTSNTGRLSSSAMQDANVNESRAQSRDSFGVTIKTERQRLSDRGLSKCSWSARRRYADKSEVLPHFQICHHRWLPLPL